MFIQEHKIYGEGKKLLLTVKNFALKKGEKIIISGPSGCGKTSFLDEIYDKRERLGVPVEWNIGYLSQKPALLDGENIYRNITGKLCYKKNIKKIDKLLQDVGVKIGKDKAKKELSKYSGGEKQRIALVKLLWGNFNLVLMDEPLSALDFEMKKIINKLYKELLSDKLVIYVTHDESEKASLIEELKFKEYKIENGVLNG